MEKEKLLIFFDILVYVSIISFILTFANISFLPSLKTFYVFVALFLVSYAIFYISMLVVSIKYSIKKVKDFYFSPFWIVGIILINILCYFFYIMRFREYLKGEFVGFARCEVCGEKLATPKDLETHKREWHQK